MLGCNLEKEFHPFQGGLEKCGHFMLRKKIRVLLVTDETRVS